MGGAGLGLSAIAATLSLAAAEFGPACVVTSCRRLSGFAPSTMPTSSPCRKTLTIGITLISHACAVSWFWSTSTLMNSHQGNSAASASKNGAIVRHGTHQVAVKYTTTARSPAAARTASNSAFVAGCLIFMERARHACSRGPFSVKSANAKIVSRPVVPNQTQLKGIQLPCCLPPAALAPSRRRAARRGRARGTP